MPLRALEDALQAQVSEAAVEQERELAAREAKQPLNDENAQHNEHVQLDDRQLEKGH